MSRRSRTITTAVAAGALVLAATVWFLFDMLPNQTTVQAVARVPQAKAEVANEAPAQPSMDAATASANKSHDHDHDDETPGVDLRPRYFEAPILRDVRTFAGSDTTMLIEASCRAHPLMANSGSAEQRLNALYAINPRERFPEDLFYRSLIQFWRYDGQYYQLSAIWDIGLPPTYTLTLHRSPTPEFAGAVSEERLPDAVTAMDAAGTAAAMARMSEEYVAKGAVLGLQILEADWPTADGKSRMRAMLANGRPVSWSFPGGACAYDDAAAALRCRCPSAREPQTPGTS
jgi:hypothetical protein